MTRIIRVPFLIPNWAIAQVLLPNIIFVREDIEPSVTLIAHELVHVHQLQRYGLIRYWLRYLTLLISSGYEGHPMEVEARVGETDPVYRRWARQVLEEA